MTPKQRSDAAKKAADARWSDKSRNLPVANYTGSIKFGDAEVPCAVLDDERRVLTQLGFLRAIGRGRPAGGASQGTAGEGLPAFLVSDNLKPFISNDLRRASTPIVFILYPASGVQNSRLLCQPLPWLQGRSHMTVAIEGEFGTPQRSSSGIDVPPKDPPRS